MWLPLVKLWLASPIGGRLAEEVTYIHHPTQATANINAIFYADSLVGQVPTKVLLDTRVVVSFAWCKFLLEEYCQKLTKSPGAVSVNSMALDVRKAKIAVSLGSFSTEEEFTVICNLTVDCLLGVDFLKEPVLLWTADVALSQLGRIHDAMIQCL